MDTFHTIILGGGPGGTAAAKTLASAGKNVALVSDELGGECLNYGCIPTKNYLWTAEILGKFSQSRSFGINAENVRADWDLMKECRAKNIKKLQQGLEFSLKKAGVNIINGRGFLSDANTIKVGTETYKADYIIIATGADPLIPKEFENNENILCNRKILTLEKIPKTLLVIGSGAVGTEFASIFAALGTEVTIAEKGDRLLYFEDPEISAEIERIFIRNNIKILKNTPVTPNQTKAYEKTLIAIGRKVNFSKLGLENTGVIFDQKSIRTNNFMQTNIKNIFAIGDIAGKMLLAYTAEREGIIAAQTILGQNPEPLNYATVPYSVFCIPEVASIGLTEPQAKEKNLDYIVGKSLYSANAKALIRGARDGFIKIIAEKSNGKILGVHIIGEKASELIAQASLAFTANINLENFSKNLYCHPIFGEILKEAALDGLNKI